MSNNNLVSSFSYEGNRTSEKIKVSVLGTGWFGQAMCKRLLESGYLVFLGTRSNSWEKKLFKLPIEPISYSEAILKTDIIILCIPQKAHLSFVENYGSLVAGKIVVDVTNPLHYHSGNDLNMSIAENLQAALSGAIVVKAFNTLSAYSLVEPKNGLTQEVYICTNDPKTLVLVAELVRKLGYSPVDFGTLAAAGSVETMPFSLFDNWKLPLAICSSIHAFFFLYLLITRYIMQDAPNYKNLPLFGFNSTVANTSLGLLSLSNLAGCLANIIHLFRGEANQSFPLWLTGWLNLRKQLGLLGFIYLGIHVSMSTLYTHLYRHISGGYITGLAQVGLLIGHISTLIYSTLSVVSLPSVSNLLSWREWQFIQSNLGWTALVAGFTHTLLMVYPFWKTVGSIPHIAMLGSTLPAITIILKLFILLPPIQVKLRLIRGKRS